MSKKRKTIRLEIVVHADTEPELYAWLSGLDEDVYGMKAKQVRAVLLAGLRGGAVAPTGGVAVTAAVNLDGLADTLLAQMRPVVEAAVTSALQGYQLTAGHAPAASAPEDAGAFTDDLVAGLMLGDD